MEFSEVVRRRRMVRHYDTERPVDPGALHRILAAATQAPSAGFTQAVEFLVLTSPIDLSRFWLTQTGDDSGATPSAWLARMRTAPALVVVTTSQQAYRDRYAEADKLAGGGPDRSWTAPYWDVDAGMSTMLLLLGAVDEGLGACFFGLASPAAERRLADEFGIPPQRSGIGVVAIGHPHADATPSDVPARRPRRGFDQQVHEGRW